jgi:large subunit ribosomal protein L19
MADLIASLTQQFKPERELPELRPGDTVRVHNRIVEGDRERVQIFQGTLMRLRHGGMSKTLTVRRIASNGVGVERTFLANSPTVEKIEVMRHGKTRRAQLYFLRDRRGRAARLKERREQAPASAQVVAPAPAESQA